MIRKQPLDLLAWKTQQHSHMLFFDGASKNKPRVAGVGGTIHDPKGNQIVNYALGLGNISNNIVEIFLMMRPLIP
jgi:ribonuclease HI